MRKSQPPSTLSCLLLLGFVDIGLRVVGYARVMRAAHRLARLGGKNEQREKLLATIEKVVTATTLYPGRSECLEQSIVAYMLLRRRGFDVHLRLGVQPYPFYAHAWLELDGEPITESPEVVSRFALLPDVAV